MVVAFALFALAVQVQMVWVALVGEVFDLVLATLDAVAVDFQPPPKPSLSPRKQCPSTSIRLI